MRIDFRSRFFIYGCWDIFFALLYLLVFTILMPAHPPVTRFLTLFFPITLLLGGTYLILAGPHARWVGLGLAGLYLFLCVGLLMALSWVIGAFRGIYGPLGMGISVLAGIQIVLVFFLVGLWPVFQLRAFWAE